MICKHCGAQVPDDGVYCPTCGKRADGTMLCPSCSARIAGDAAYCMYCGNRVDGKTVCARCGEAFVGDYCPKCGLPAKTKKNKPPRSRNVRYSPTRSAVGSQAVEHKPRENQAAVKAEKSNKERHADVQLNFRSAASVLTPSLSLAAILALFICSFFIGYAGVGGESSNTFYLFGKYYDDIAEIIRHFDEGEGAFMRLCYYLPAIVTTVILAVNLLVAFTTLLVGVIKLGTELHRGKPVSISKLTCYARSLRS